MKSIEVFLSQVLPGFRLVGDSCITAGGTEQRVVCGGANYTLFVALPEYVNIHMQLATAFAQIGVNVPDIIDSDLDAGYLLLSDFGNNVLQYSVMTDPNCWLPMALDVLLRFQVRGGQHVLELPLYDSSLLLRELSLFPEWFVTELLGEKLNADEERQLVNLNQLLIDNAANQPQVWVHHDFHSRHLIRLDDDQLGVTGFHHAVFGAVAYDVASILKDSYVRYPKALVRNQLEQYHIKLVECERYFKDFDQFERDVDFTGLQRHLKVLGLFARQSIQGDSPAQLNDLPLVFDYVFDVVQKYHELNRYFPMFERLGVKFEQKILS